MMEYSFVDIGLGAIMTIIMAALKYIINQKDKEISEIKRDLNHIRESYVTKNDVNERFDRIENKLDKLFDIAYNERKSH